MNTGNNERCEKCGQNELVVLSSDIMNPTWLHFRCSDCGYAGTYDTALRRVIESNR